MKKVVLILLAMMLLSSVMAVPVMATETTREVVEVYEDGSYAVLEKTEVIVSNARSSTVSKSASSTCHYYNGNDEEQWSYTLNGTFLYRYGSGAQAQNRSDSYKIYNSEWSMVSHDSSVGSDTVYGTVTMKMTVLFITIRTVTQDLSITCDMYGNITYDP